MHERDDDDTARVPGEVRSTRLSRPPSERYPPAARAHDPVLDPAPARLVRAGGLGTLAGIAVALAFGVAVGIFDLGAGLLVLAVLGGMGIGAAVRQGAWSGRAHAADVRVRTLASVIALGAWVAGAVVDYLLGLLFLPASAVDLPSRIDAAPFPGYLSARFGVLEILELLLVGAFAWRSAR